MTTAKPTERAVADIGENDAIVVENLSKVFHVLRREQSVKSAALARLRLQRPHREAFTALHNVSFRVPRGQAVGVVGRNGSGKSTLLSLLSRIYRPTTGRIAVRGRVSALLELSAGFNPEFTGMENIFLNGVMLGLTRTQIEERLQAMLDFADIGEYIHTPVKHYSSGMTMRLGFSLAVHVEPDILLVDEALAVGDAPFQEKCFSKIEEFQAQGKTIFFVSHDIETMRRICHRVLWIQNHSLRADGQAAEVLHEYSL